MAKQDNPNTYCYDLVASKICKGVEKTLLSSKECAGAITVNNWSPNNIRRLVISPSGFIVQYYVNAKNSKLLDIGLFDNISKLNLCFASDDYKPMLKALFDIRVCSCIEEIVYLTKPNANGMYLPLEEIQLKQFNTGFKRLHGRIFLDMSLEEFYKAFKDSLAKPDFHLCDENIPNAKVDILAKDWWKYYPLRPVYYTLDAEGGKLDKYFSKVKEGIESKLEAKKIQDVKKKVLGDSVDKLLKADNRLSYTLKGAFRFKSLLEKGQENLYAFLSDEYKEPVGLLQKIQSVVSSKRFELGDLKEISSLNKTFLSKCSVSFVTVDEYEGSESDLYASTKECLDSITGLVYLTICDYMLNLVNSVAEEATLTVEYILRGIERVILIPKPLERKAFVISDLCGLDFEGKDIKHSVCNCLLICCKMSLTDGDKYNKEYWLKVVGGEN